MSFLEEAQGLTVEMVTSYLTTADWTRTVTATGPRWSAPGTTRRSDSWSEENLNLLVCRIAETERLTEQAMLRKINPRLRPLPSPAARKAHPGRWIAVNPEGHGYLIRFDETILDTAQPRHIASFTTHIHRRRAETGERDVVEEQVFRISEDQLVRWRFWSTDDSGNKVPWPTKKGGELL